MIFGVVNQIFRSAASLFDGALRLLKPVFDPPGDGFFHVLNCASKLNSGDPEFCNFAKHSGFHLSFLR